MARMHVGKAAFASTAMALLLACSDRGASTDPASVRSPITNGALDAADPAVVALVDGDGKIFCSGTLIAPHVVLTAAHCVTSIRARDEKTTVVFGADVAGDALRISDVHVHPDHQAATFANDVALLALAAKAPVDPVALLPGTSDALVVGGNVRVVGFGATGAPAIDVGKKRRGDATIATVDATTFTLSPSPSQPCTGDSGGPAFVVVSGTEYVAGVTSHGDDACASRSTETRVDAYADFVAAYVAKAAEGAAHAGERCFYDGHCASGACVAAVDDPHVTYCAPTCADGCPSGMECSEGACRYPLPTPGAIGSTCASAADCVSTECNAEHVCSHRCSDDAQCPSNFRCQRVGEIEFSCMPSKPEPPPSSSCAATRAATSPSFASIAVVSTIVAAASRRRRRDR